MRVLRKGMRGDDVAKWQLFLHGQGFLFTKARDGIFGSETKKRTEEFQMKHKLVPDGVVGNLTFGVAMQLGFEGVPFLDEPGIKFPDRPGFDPISGNEGRQALFGPLKFKAGPKNGGFGKETITITNNFESSKIVKLNIPELAGIKGAPSSGNVRWHSSCPDQLAGLWAAWGRRKLLSRVLTWDGSFAARFVRCSTISLSNHAFGTAFDINASQNPLGAQPALSGKPGCVFELVPIAYQFGFYWGGLFSRRDGMHFEVAKILTPGQVAAALSKF